MHPAVSSLLSYGLVVHLLLLSTTHRCVAVAFGFRPESVYLERTCTSLTTRAFRRTSPAFQRRVGSTKQSRRVATAEKSLRILGKSVVAPRRGQLTTRSPALKRRAKVMPTLRVEVT